MWTKFYPKKKRTQAGIETYSLVPRHRVGDEERRFHASSPSTSGKTNEKPSYIQTRQQSVQPWAQNLCWTADRWLGDTLHLSKLLQIWAKSRQRTAQRRCKERTLTACWALGNVFTWGPFFGVDSWDLGYCRFSNDNRVTPSTRWLSIRWFSSQSVSRIVSSDNLGIQDVEHLSIDPLLKRL